MSPASPPEGGRMTDVVDTNIHMPANDEAHSLWTTNPDAHFPPQPTPAPADLPGIEWNPGTNEWAPSNTPIGGGSAEGANQEPSHGDVQPASPQSSEPGVVTGTTPDARGTLLSSVRNPPASTPLPVQRVEHVITTQEEGNDLVRTRTVRVSGTVPVVLLEENPHRTRALLKLVTSNGVITISPIRQGGIGASTAGVPTAPNAGYMIATGDPVHESKSKAGIEALVEDTGASTFCDVTIWEEMSVPGDHPGVGI